MSEKQGKIVKVKSAEWETGLKLPEECTEWLSKHGMHYWENYYTNELITKRITESEVYLIYANETPVGTVPITAGKAHSSPEYEKTWKDKPNALYLNSLGVVPSIRERALPQGSSNFQGREQNKKVSAIYVS